MDHAPQIEDEAVIALGERERSRTGAASSANRRRSRRSTLANPSASQGGDQFALQARDQRRAVIGERGVELHQARARAHLGQRIARRWRRRRRRPARAARAPAAPPGAARSWSSANSGAPESPPAFARMRRAQAGRPRDRGVGNDQPLRARRRRRSPPRHAMPSPDRSGAIFTSSGGRCGTARRRRAGWRAAAPRLAGRAGPACSARRR